MDMNVSKWRKRCLKVSFEGLYGELRIGRVLYEDVKVAEVINWTLDANPNNGTVQCSACSFAAAIYIPKLIVHPYSPYA